MQNQNLILAGASATPVVAQCACEGMEIYSTATFTFQYATRASEVPPTQPGQTQGQMSAAQPNGDASVAESITASDFKFIAESARNQPWAKGETIAFVVAVNPQALLCRPPRAGG